MNFIQKSNETNPQIISQDSFISADVNKKLYKF